MATYQSTKDHTRPVRVEPTNDDAYYYDGIDLALAACMLVSGIGVLALFAVTFFSS